MKSLLHIIVDLIEVCVNTDNMTRQKASQLTRMALLEVEPRMTIMNPSQVSELYDAFVTKGDCVSLGTGPGELYLMDVFADLLVAKNAAMVYKAQVDMLRERAIHRSQAVRDCIMKQEVHYIGAAGDVLHGINKQRFADDIVKALED
jgi:hypothetical protein